jgi:hypothetical protein
MDTASKYENLVKIAKHVVFSKGFNGIDAHEVVSEAILKIGDLEKITKNNLFEIARDLHFTNSSTEDTIGFESISHLRNKSSFKKNRHIPCKKCQDSYLSGNFRKIIASNRTYYCYICKICEAKYKSEWRQKNKANPIYKKTKCETQKKLYHTKLKLKISYQIKNRRRAKSYYDSKKDDPLFVKTIRDRAKKRYSEVKNMIDFKKKNQEKARKRYDKIRDDPEFIKRSREKSAYYRNLKNNNKHESFIYIKNRI